MRFLLLSVLVVCVIGIMVPSAFAQLHLCEQSGGVIVFDDRGNMSCNMQGAIPPSQQPGYPPNTTMADVEIFFEFVKYAILIIVATVSAILIINGIVKSRSGNRKPVRQQPRFCENCGNILKPTAKFCAKCGNQV